MEGRRLGRYVLGTQIGVGGMGTVYVATDTHLDRQVALKILSAPLAASTGFRERFQREAATLARLDSPHVIAIFDHGEQDGVPWLATQYVRGGDLERLIAERGPMPPEGARSVCLQVAEGLTDAHRVGVVHRDIKPSNVLVRDPDAERLHVYLCDFGIALDESSGRLTTAGSVFGTWSYLAPERSQGRATTPASDVYSLGCLLWACLTGQAPYVGTDVAVAMAHVNAPVRQLAGADDFSRGVNEVLLASMAKDPAARYSSAADFHRALAAVPAAAGPVAARPLPPTSPPPGAAPVPPGIPTGPPAVPPPLSPGSTVPRGPVPPRRRSRGVVLAAVAAVVAVLVLVTVLVAVTSGDDDPGPGPEAGGSSEEGGEEGGEDEPVTNDVDADGRGDAVAYYADGRRSTRYTFSSTGSAFVVDRATLDAFEYPVYLDVDGDGELDRVDAVPTQGDGLRLDSSENGLDGQTYPGIGLVADPDLFYVEVLTGDFDGDGRPDLLVWGQTDRLEVTVWVLVGDGEGGFADPEVWATLDGQHVYTTFLRSGDFDGDGVTDVLATLPDGQPELARTGATWEGESGLQLYRSTGEEFTPDGSLRVLPGLTYSTVVVGDFTGEDRPMVAVSDFGTATVVVYGLDEADRRPRLELTVTVDDPIAEDGQLEMLPSDVDGDGDDDLVLTKTGETAADVFVSISEDGELTEPEPWGELPPCLSRKASQCRFSWFLSN